jgi:DNA-directed RNA polymerase subunit RPC12/RpoP
VTTTTFGRRLINSGNTTDFAMSIQKVACHRCGYEWWTKSKLIRVTCPSCGAKVWLVRREALENIKPRK